MESVLERAIQRMNRGIIIAQNVIEKNPNIEKVKEAKQAIEELQVLKESTEKQIPKEITRKSIEESYKCPTCNVKKFWREGSFCDCCGQRLDWKAGNA